MLEEHIKIGKVSQSEAQKAEDEYKKLKKEFKARYKVKNELRKNYAYINSQYLNYSKALTILEQFDDDKVKAEQRLNEIQGAGIDPATIPYIANLQYNNSTKNTYQNMVDSITSKNNNGKITTDLKSIKINIFMQNSTPPYDEFIQNAKKLEKQMKIMEAAVNRANRDYGLNLHCNNMNNLTPEKKRGKYVDTYMHAKHIKDKNIKKAERKAKRYERHYRHLRKSKEDQDYDMGDR